MGLPGSTPATFEDHTMNNLREKRNKPRYYHLFRNLAMVSSLCSCSIGGVLQNLFGYRVSRGRNDFEMLSGPFLEFDFLWLR